MSSGKERETGEIKLIRGQGRILLIAPHGFPGDPSRKLPADEENTGVFVERLARRFGFYAVINEKYKKTKKGEEPDLARGIVDLNRIDQVTGNVEREFLTPMLRYKTEILKNYGSPLIFLIHGIEDKNICREADAHTAILIGYGQGDRGLDRHTAEGWVIDSVIKYLAENKEHSIKAIETPPGSKNYRGRDKNNLNQLFRHNQYWDHRVQSVQLEIRYTGCRDEGHIDVTVEALGEALSALSRTNDTVEHKAVE